MFRALLFISSLAIFAGSVHSLLGYWQYDEKVNDIGAMLLQQVSSEDVAQHVQTAIERENPDDARMYLSLAHTFGYQVDAQRYEAAITALEQPWVQTQRNVKQFTSGFLEGEAESGAGVAGAIAADFTVVGDVRDLYEQYQLYEQGRETNALITTLAGVGVGLTAATVLSSGAASPAKAGTSTMKMAVRSGRITPRFQAVLLRQGQAVFDHKAFLAAMRGEKRLVKVRRAALQAYKPAAVRALKTTAGQVNDIRKATSLGDTVRLLRYVDNGDDLRRLQKVSLKYGAQTKGVMKLLGKAAIGTTRVLRKSLEWFVSLAASVLSLLAMLVTAVRSAK